jgi:hypothetical protein
VGNLSLQESSCPLRGPSETTAHGEALRKGTHAHVCIPPMFMDYERHTNGFELPLCPVVLVANGLQLSLETWPLLML